MRSRLMVLLACATIALGGCGAAVTSPSPSSAGSVAPATSSASPTQAGGPPDLFNTTYADRVKQGQPGGTLIIADWQEANLFNYYYQGQVTENDLASTYFSGFTTTTDDLRYVPDLAVDIPTLDNGGVKVPGDSGHAMTTTWKLRDGLKWSDGQDLTCEDAKFTWEWNVDPDNTGLYGGTTGWEDIAAIDCPDPKTVVIQWDNVYEGYITLFAAILPRHYLQPIPVAQAATKAYIGADMPNVPVSGPFKFESVTPGVEVRMVRNDMWKNAQGRSAYLDGLIFKWYSDPDAMIAGYRSGEYDIAKDLQNADLPKLAEVMNDVQRMTALSYELHRPNWASPVMSDPAMREAYRYAIDKDVINQRIVGGSAKVTDLAISPATWYYPGDPGRTPFDPERAKKILDDAGWAVGADGVREKNGVRAEIKLCTTTAQYRVDTLTLVAGWLSDIGIRANVTPVSPNDIFGTWNESTDQTPCNLAHGNFDVAEHGFTSPLDPLGNYATYHSSQFEPAGSNDAKVSNPDLDEALDTVRSSVDFSVVRDAMKTFSDVYVKQTIEVPLYYRDEVWIVSPKVGNFTGNATTAGPTWNAGDWYVAP